MTLTPESTTTPVEKLRESIAEQTIQLGRLVVIITAAQAELAGRISKHSTLDAGLLAIHLDVPAIEGREAAKAIMAALGGRWERRVSHGGGYFNYRGTLNDCTIPVVIFNVEPIPAPEPI